MYASSQKVIQDSCLAVAVELVTDSPSGHDQVQRWFGSTWAAHRLPAPLGECGSSVELKKQRSKLTARHGTGEGVAVQRRGPRSLCGDPLPAHGGGLSSLGTRPPPSRLTQ